MFAPELRFWGAALASALAAAWAAWRTVACIRRDRILADTPLVRIRSAAQGYVKVRGRARCASDPPTAAPLSGRPCVWWSFRVEQRYRNARGQTEWRSVETAASVEPFVLADADAECLIGPVSAEITATQTDIWHGDRPRPDGIPFERGRLLPEADYRYTERLLGIGDLLSVAGELRSHSEMANAEATAAAILHAWKQDQRGLLARFDRNDDGRLDAAEWEAARQAAEQEAQTAMLKAPVVRTKLIGEPTHGEPFVIASLDSAHLVRRERVRAALHLTLGLVFSACCAWAIEHALMSGAP